VWREGEEREKREERVEEGLKKILRRATYLSFN